MRRLGDITCELELELLHLFDEGYSLKQIFSMLYCWTLKNAPSAIEEYEDNTNPHFIGKKITPKFTNNMEDLLEELLIKHEAQLHEIYGIIYAYTCIHMPDKISKNMIYYKPR